MPQPKPPGRALRVLRYVCAGIALVLAVTMLVVGFTGRPYQEVLPDYGFTEDDSPTPGDFALKYISRPSPDAPTYTISVDARGNTTGTTSAMAAADVARLWHLANGYHFFEWRTPVAHRGPREDRFASRLEVNGNGHLNSVRCIDGCPRGWNEIVALALQKMPPKESP